MRLSRIKYGRSLVAVFVGCLLFVGCGSASSVTPTCAASATRCRCSNATFTLEEGENAVASCANFPTAGGAWACSYDLDSTGQSTMCTCQPFGCSAKFTDTSKAIYIGIWNECSCGPGIGGGDLGSAEDGSTVSVYACPALTPVTAGAGKEEPSACCSDGSGGCQCYSSGEVEHCGSNSPIPVASCTDTPTFSPSVRLAASCDGLVWMAPTPPADTTGGGGGSDDPCGGSCGGCATCTTSGCESCPVGEEGICSC